MSKFSGANAPMQPTPEMIRNSQTVECECGGVLFSEKLMFKKLSSIVSPTGRDEIIPMPLFICEKCGKVPVIFDPLGLVPAELKTTVEPIEGIQEEAKVVEMKPKQ